MYRKIMNIFVSVLRTLARLREHTQNGLGIIFCKRFPLDMLALSKLVLIAYNIR